MNKKVAILPWGNVIEDFLDPIGVSLDGFATGMTGGWLFGYAAALRSAGLDACLICVSDRTRRTRRIVNPESGLVTVVLPARRSFAAGVALLGNPDRAIAENPTLARVQSLLRYVATPVGPLVRALREEGCTHLICQEYESPRFDIALRAARRAGIGAFASFQGGTPGLTGLEHRIRRRSIAAADGLIVASGPEIDRLRQIHGAALPPVARICNPLDLEAWRSEPRGAARRALGLPEAAFVAICHCRIDYRRKGLDILLAAWRMLAARHPERDLRLHLIGSGADDALLADAIARDPVRGLAWDRGYSLDRAVMRRRLSAADAYVLASRHEGFPVAPLEAMACGLPAILSDAAAADILPGGPRDGGLTVPTGDPGALTGALERLMTDPQGRAAMAEAARARVAAIASFSVVGAQLADFLRGSEPLPVTTRSG